MIFDYCKEKDVSQELLDNYNIPYTSRGTGSDSLWENFLFTKGRFPIAKIS